MADEKQLSLKQAGQYDHDNGLKFKLTGWGIICKQRHEKKISRKTRREKK